MDDWYENDTKQVQHRARRFNVEHLISATHAILLHRGIFISISDYPSLEESALKCF